MNERTTEAAPMMPNRAERDSGFTTHFYSVSPQVASRCTHGSLAPDSPGKGSS
jgi:hypothetical protein